MFSFNLLHVQSGHSFFVMGHVIFKDFLRIYYFFKMLQEIENLMFFILRCATFSEAAVLYQLMI